VVRVGLPDLLTPRVVIIQGHLQGRRIKSLGISV
jgi:hypothetical protein